MSGMDLSGAKDTGRMLALNGALAHAGFSQEIGEGEKHHD